MAMLRLSGGTTPLASARTRSPNRIEPSLGVSNPAIIRSTVVLPQPDGPSSARKPPSLMSSETSFTAGLPVP